MTVPTRFDLETSTRALDATEHDGFVDPHWSIDGNPNGGYLMAIAVAALRAHCPQHPDPLSVTVHYQRPGSDGQACRVSCALLRSGRMLSTGRATLSQGGKARLDLIAAFGDLAEEQDPRAAGERGAIADSRRASRLPPLAPPGIPAPDDCIGRSGMAQGVDLAILDRLDLRLDPAQAEAGRAGRAQITGWVRFCDGRDPDSLAALLFADAFPPSIFGLLGAVGWVPTIELTVHVRRRPAPGWVLGRFESFDLAGGRLIEDGWLWDAEGQLFAQSRQLALLRAG